MNLHLYFFLLFIILSANFCKCDQHYPPEPYREAGINPLERPWTNLIKTSNEGTVRVVREDLMIKPQFEPYREFGRSPLERP
uniref:Uncharacterized protein n=1 Tax=Acrobeloides nanus TaxID=290746 RepID=A0A914DTU9_9BILA